MLIAISVNHAEHQKQHAGAMKAGVERHGHRSVFTDADTVVPDADVHVTWSVKQPRIFAHSREAGKHVLVMERAHVPDRFAYTSCGWDGLANRGRYFDGRDGGARWRERYGHLMQPWGPGSGSGAGGRFALVIGQVRGDAALYGVDFDQWQQDVTDRLLALGWDVAYRPHPLMRRHNQEKCPIGAGMTVGSLEDDLKRAGLVVSFNSTTGVEAVLAGVPTVVMDEGGMAFDVALHRLPAPEEVFDEPDPASGYGASRESWAHRLAWAQWSLDEIASGETWAALEMVM